MATEVRNQLDRKLAGGPRPGPMQSSTSLWPTAEERKAMKMAKAAMEAKEKQAALRAAGVSATVVIEAED